MEKIKNKLISLFMVFVVVFTMMTPVFAYGDTIEEDFENILSSDFQSRNYDKTFVIPGYENLKNMGIIFDNNYNSKGYSCFIQYINADFKAYHLLENSFEDKIYDLEKGYYYILYLGNSSVNQFSIYDVYCEELEDNKYVYSLYNFAANYNKSRRDFIVSKDGVDWFYIDNDLNIDNVDLNTVPLSDYITDESGFINRPMNILYFSPTLASHFYEYDKLQESQVAAKYTNLTTSLYQFGTGHIPSDLLLYPTNITIAENNFRYPSETTEYTIKVPYDISYLNFGGSSSAPFSADVIWVSFGNRKTKDGEYLEVQNLNSIVFNLYTHNLSKHRFGIAISEFDENGERISVTSTTTLFNNDKLSSYKTYSTKVYLNTKCDLLVGHNYVIHIIDLDTLEYIESIGVTPLSDVHLVETITGSPTEGDSYAAVAGKDTTIVGDITDSQEPNINKDIYNHVTDIVIDENYKFDTGSKMLDGILNLFGFRVLKFWNNLLIFYNEFVDNLSDFVDNIENISQVIGKAFEAFPEDLQRIVSFIFKSFLAILALKLVFAILG